jgi:hypothetical protein
MKIQEILQLPTDTFESMTDAQLKEILDPFLPEVQRMDDAAQVDVTNELLAKAYKVLGTNPTSASIQYTNDTSPTQPQQ